MASTIVDIVISVGGRRSGKPKLDGGKGDN